MSNVRNKLAVIASAAAVLLSVTTAPIASAIGAATIFHIRGVVSDPIGRPLAGARVDDGNQSLLTDVTGAYDLPEENPGTYDVTAQRADTTSVTTTVGANVPADKTANITLEYLIAGAFAPGSVQPGVDVRLVVETAAPDPDPTANELGDPCVRVHNALTDLDEDAVRTNLSGPRWGYPLWQYDITVPPSTTDNEYAFVVWAEDCATGTPLTSESFAFLVVDGTAPTVSVPEHAWVGPAASVDVSVTDGGTFPSGVDATSIITTIDGNESPHSYDSEAEILSLDLTGVPVGDHAALVTAADYAGNTTTESFLVTVDGDVPSVANPSPTGVIHDATPKLEAYGADATSGIAPGAIELRISNGIQSARLNANYEPSTGLISYQVPEIPTGLGPGSGPLPPGKYSVVVRVSDRVGNDIERSWSFEYAPETVVLPSIHW